MFPHLSNQSDQAGGEKSKGLAVKTQTVVGEHTVHPLHKGLNRIEPLFI